MKIIFTAIAISFFCCLTNRTNAQQDSLYQRLINEGHVLHAKGAYKAALNKFFSAGACDVSEALKQVSEVLVSMTSKEWTQDSENRKKKAIEQENIATEAKIAAEKAAVIIRSYFLAGISNRATNGKDAYHAAFLARDTIERYNQQHPKTPIVLPTDVSLSFNNAVFQHKKKDTLAHNSSIMHLAFANSSSRFVTVGRDGFVKVWDTQLNLIFSTKKSKHFFLSADLSPDGHFLLTTSKNNIAHLWNIDTNENIPLLGHQGAVVKGLFLKNGQKVITIDRAGLVKVWNEKGELENEAMSWKSPKPLINITLNPNGKNVLLHTIDAIYLYALDSLENVPTNIKQHKENDLIINACYSSNGKEILTTSKYQANVWDINKKKNINKYTSFDSSTIYAAIMYASEMNNLVLGTKTGFLSSPKDGNEVVRNYQHPILQVIRSQKGKGNIIIARSNKAINIHNHSKRDTLVTINEHIKVKSLIYTTDFKIVNQEALLVTIEKAKVGSTEIWSLDGKKLMDMRMDSPVIGATLVGDCIIAHTSSGRLYSVPFPEMVYQQSIMPIIKQSLSPQLKKELEDIQRQD